MENMNKIPHMWKGIDIRIGFHTLMCERGQLHEGKVKFNQVKQHCHRRSGSLWKTAQCEWGRGYLVEETLMGGAHGEREFTFLKGGQGNHCFSWIRLLISCLCRHCAYSCCLAELLGEFLFRISSPSREVSWGTILLARNFLALGQSYSFHPQCSSYSR